jgi:hypothetical protein
MMASILGHFLSSEVFFVYFCVLVLVVVRPAVYTFVIHWLGFAVLQIVIACA